MANFNLNKTLLGGRLTSDVELKQTQSGIPVCTFRVAVNRKYAKEGEQSADFITCIAWKTTAEFISRYFKKGSSICVAGSIQTNSWTDNAGQKRYNFEILVDEVFFVDSKTETEVNSAPAFTPAATPNFEELSTDADLPF